MATLEQIVLDGLSLNDVTNYRLQGVDAPPPKKRFEWAEGGDADGAALVRDPLFENRTVELRVRVAQRASMDLALAAVAAISDKLEEADRQPDGLDLVWTPANGTKSVTFKVLAGEITGLPITMDGDDAGWFKNSPVITITLTCKPFGYGPEVTGSGTSSATPFVTLTVAGVTGDVPAEGRLIVTDAATQSRRYAEWGLEQRNYDAATSLLVDSDSMVVSGTAGTQTTRTGAYDPNATGNNVIRATLNRGNVTVATTGVLAHVGTFRVKARVFASSAAVTVRLVWQEGDGPFRPNPYVIVPVAGAFAEIDLGLISIPTKTLGTQGWLGRVEAHCEVAGDTVDLDYLVLVPAAEGYGRVRAVGPVAAATAVGYDDFTTLTPAAVLNARVAPSGGTWATSGATTDFQGATSSGISDVRRSTVSDSTLRFAILGATNYTDTQVEVYGMTTFWSSLQIQMGAIARWVDSSNFLYVRLSSHLPLSVNFGVFQMVAGVSTQIASANIAPQINVQYGMRLIAYATGTVIAELRAGTPSSAPPTLIARGSSSAVATGGVLATGKPGFFDQNALPTAYTRAYDWFSVANPGPEPVAINSGRGLEVRHDSTIRADATNTYWGPVPAYRGSRFLVPPAGAANRTSRVLVKAHRQDIEVADAANVTDNLTAQVNYTPRYLVVPR